MEPLIDLLSCFNSLETCTRSALQAYTDLSVRQQIHPSGCRSQCEEKKETLVEILAMQDAAPAEPEAQPEPNLLDLDDLNISEPSPATLGTPEITANGFGSDYASPPGLVHLDCIVAQGAI